MIELTLGIFEKPKEKIDWRSAGAIHHIGRMNKLLYSFKIFRYQDNPEVLCLSKGGKATEMICAVQSAFLQQIMTKDPLTSESDLLL